MYTASYFEMSTKFALYYKNIYYLYSYLYYYLYVDCKHQKSSSPKFRPHSHQQHKMSDRPKTPDMPADVFSTAVDTLSTPDEISIILTENSCISSQNLEHSCISVEILDNPAQSSGNLSEKLGILAQEMDIEAERLKILAGYLGVSAENLEISANSLDNPDILRMAVDMSGIIRTSGIPNEYYSILVENLNVHSYGLGIIESCLDIVEKTFGIKLDLSIPRDIYGLSVETRVQRSMKRIRISQQRARLLQQATRESQQIIPVWESTVSMFEDSVKTYQDQCRRFQERRTRALQRRLGTPTYN